jgi:DNA-binding transcriptional LysR family regulator
LKTFIAVAEYGNFARAANAVGLTRSAVSMQFRMLENLLGIQLFDRSQRPSALNEHCKAPAPFHPQQQRMRPVIC